MPHSSRSAHLARRTHRTDAADPIFESARFSLSVAEPEQLNRAALAMLPEIAFAGRSNSGKSSVINVLTNQRRLAFASKTPGRTQLLNFFTLSRRTEGGIEPVAHLVDLPGYGFARVDDVTRQRWDRLAGGYLKTRRMLACVVLVVDARRGLLAADEQLLAWISDRSPLAAPHLHLLLNKADELNTAERREAVTRAESTIGRLPLANSIQLFSALKRTGIDELRARLASVLEQPRV